MVHVHDVVEKAARLVPEALREARRGEGREATPARKLAVVLSANRTARLLAMTGLREPSAWDRAAGASFDFYDLKGRVEMLLRGLRLRDAEFVPAEDAAHLHPGRAAQLLVAGAPVGILGELHPLIQAHYDFGEAPVLAAEFDLRALRASAVAAAIVPVPNFPAIFEDIAVVIREDLPASQVESLIRTAGGELLSEVRLFDLYRGDQIAAGMKSLAYRLTYRAADRTLTDAEAASIRNQIIRRLEQDLSAKLRA